MVSSVDPVVLREMEQQVDIYDAAVRTGNEALDVILTEKSLMCERENVTLSCIADGDCIAFMAASDVYSLMGNALDNALEAARRMKDPERRSISLVLRARASMAVLHIENYYAGELRFGHGEDLPATTKADAASHGYGMKSMQLVAKKYHGNIHARAADGVFHLNVVLPLPT